VIVSAYFLFLFTDFVPENAMFNQRLPLKNFGGWLMCSLMLLYVVTNISMLLCNLALELKQWLRN
jgi:hypothetical protein